MKKYIFTLLFTLMSLAVSAQFKVAYYSNDAVLHSMAEYQQAQNDLKSLKQQYDKETKRAQEEFNAKYEEFLDEVNTLAPSIRRKRQIELHQAMETNIKFRDEANRLLKQAEKDAIAPLQARINEVLRLIAAEHSYAVIVNTDSNACPYISPLISEDINTLVSESLKQ
ncbi:MAG: OmpH family outer membrane protein [Prevotella sp.]|nr:OmpH family outer membrane protein [Prevotella sp.]